MGLYDITGISQEFITGDENLEVLSDVSFSIKANTFNIIFGQSGSGKSTLLNIMSGLQKPTSGAITYNGRALYNMTSDELARFRAENIGIIYQTNYWVKSLSVLDNVILPMLFLGYTKEEVKPMAYDALDLIGMRAYANRNAFYLSGGEQQRVAFARAVVNKPSIIIADEPTGNLDTKNGDMMIELLRDYLINNSGTVIMVTHNLEYLPLADHLLRIQDGHVEDLKSTSHTKMTQELMQEMKERILNLEEHLKKKEKHG